MLNILIAIDMRILCPKTLQCNLSDMVDWKSVYCNNVQFPDGRNVCKQFCSIERDEWIFDIFYPSYVRVLKFLIRWYNVCKLSIIYMMFIIYFQFFCEFCNSYAIQLKFSFCRDAHTSQCYEITVACCTFEHLCLCRIYSNDILFVYCIKSKYTRAHKRRETFSVYVLGFLEIFYDWMKC